MPEKIIIDTDFADDIDDAIAVSFGVRWPEVDVLAITLCHYVTHERGRMLAKHLDSLGAGDIPYAPGLTRPVAAVTEEKAADAKRRLPLQRGYVGEDERVPPPADGDAVELMRRTIEAHPGEVTLVTIGPMTNAADLFRRYPDTPKMLKAVAMMGGDFPSERIEYNVKSDPEAARLVFAAPTRKFLGTFEVTRRVRMLEGEIAALRASDAPSCQSLVRQIDLWWPHKGGKPGPVVYDMSPVLWTARPDFFETETRRMDVLLDGAERGRCVESADGRPVEMSVDMRTDDALALLMETLL